MLLIWLGRARAYALGNHKMLSLEESPRNTNERGTSGSDVPHTSPRPLHYPQPTWRLCAPGHIEGLVMPRELTRIRSTNTSSTSSDIASPLPMGRETQITGKAPTPRIACMKGLTSDSSFPKATTLRSLAMNARPAPRGSGRMELTWGTKGFSPSPT